MRHFVAALMGSWIASTGSAVADVSVTATTGPVPAPNNTFAPANSVAVWVEDSAGAFVKTITRHAAVRAVHLVAWRQKAGANDVDAVAGASRINHVTPISMTWDLTNKAGVEVADGTYTIRMELTEENSQTANQNNQGTFTFVKSTTPQMQTGLANGGFSNVTIDFQPLAAPPPPGNDAGADDIDDPDPNAPDEITGGCNTGKSSGLALMLALLALLSRSTRRRGA